MLGIFAGCGPAAAGDPVPPVAVSMTEAGRRRGFRPGSPLPRRGRWRREFRGDLFDAAFAGVHLNLDMIVKDRNQNEFTKQIWDYLDTAVSEDRVAMGIAALARRTARCSTGSRRSYGVEAEVVAAIWGLESAYGTYRGIGAGDRIAGDAGL